MGPFKNYYRFQEKVEVNLFGKKFHKNTIGNLRESNNSDQSV